MNTKPKKILIPLEMNAKTKKLWNLLELNEKTKKIMKSTWTECQN